MKRAQQPDRYRSWSGYYDLFELVFRLGGKGSPREGLLRQIPNNSLKVLEICVGTAANACLLAQANTPQGHRPLQPEFVELGTLLE